MVRTLSIIVLTLNVWAALPGQGNPTRPAVTEGTVTSPEGSTVIPGVEIRLLDPAGEKIILTSVSDDMGAFLFENIPAGSYRLEASLEGFRTESMALELQAGEHRHVDFALSVAGVDQSIEVVSQTAPVIPDTGSSSQQLKAELINVAPAKGDDFQALLPLLPGVVRAADGRIAMKGAVPTQSSLVVNSSTNATDPATGNFGFNLPSDAIDTVDVMPNPYAAEFGRFSAGVTNIATQRGTNKWKFLLNNFLPRLKVRDGAVMGIGGFTPRLGVRGPLIKDKLFFAQTFQYRYVLTRIPGQPDLENDTRLESFDSFTQLDAILNERHSLSATVSVFPRRLDFTNLDTFNPKEVTSNFHQRGYSISLSEQAAFSGSQVLESTVAFKSFDADVFGQGLDEMWMAPDGNRGNFFNTQRRRTKTIQWVEQFTRVVEGWGGEHVVKLGSDLLYSSFDGLSESRPVNIVRADGTTARRIDFLGATSQRARSTDLAFFGQDRWRMNERFLLELGARVDRDDVLEGVHFSPRLGFVIGILPEDRAFLRGGAGLFYERTPLSVGAFETYEEQVITDFAGDGHTAVGDPVAYGLKAAGDMETPHSLTWNIEYDHRLSGPLLFKVNYLRRHGYNEFLIDPIEGPEPYYQLDSRGQSRYWEVELTTRYSFDQDLQYLVFSYVRSKSERDLNSFDEFYGNQRNPIIRPNEYSLANTDTPNRFLVQGSLKLPGKWLVSPVIEVRNGFPYSTIDENRNFVGVRNRAGRFPWLTTVDLDIQKWFRIWKWNTRIGIRFFNLLNTFNPRDVQNNIDSGNFGVFSNTIPRLIGGTFQIES